nr:MAG TPA: hypothetical protein [Caudoviricetes sp.]
MLAMTYLSFQIQIINHNSRLVLYCAQSKVILGLEYLY